MSLSKIKTRAKMKAPHLDNLWMLHLKRDLKRARHLIKIKRERRSNLVSNRTKIATFATLMTSGKTMVS